MARLQLKPAPQPEQLWLSTPPYLMIARVVAVEQQPDGGSVVSYKLYDEDGFMLEHVEHAELDDGWWRAFQPLEPRYG
jgi:hypothetical protein